MSFISFIQLLLRNKKWVILFPLLTAFLVFILTKDMPRTYSSEMVIYTGIASGYSVDNDITGKIDYHEANSRFDNLVNMITSRETRKEVALRLLAEMLHSQVQLKQILGSEKSGQLNWLIDPFATKGLKGSSVEATIVNLETKLRKGETEQIYKLVYGDKLNPFNIQTLSAIKASRIGFSDMVKVEYTAGHPITTQRTLEILSDVFLQKYKGMRVGEVSSAVKYFEEQTALALSRLQLTEERLKSFRTSNRVINYYEQTKYIADQKEDLEQRGTTAEMDLRGFQSALRKIEMKLDSRALSKLKSEEVLKARNELAVRYNSMAHSMVRGQKNTQTLALPTEELKEELKASIDDLYTLNNSTEGIPGKLLLDQWLDLTVHVEESQAKLKVLNRHKLEFDKVYDHFAPMGSDLNKLERDVDVAEKEYLNLLHNLNQARLRERNLVVTENIAVTDPPELPSLPNASKRLLLVIATLFACSFLIMVILVLSEYLDESIGNPARFFERTGMTCATAFNGIDIEEAHVMSYEHWKLQLLDLANQAEGKAVKILAVPLHQSSHDYQAMIARVTSSLVEDGHDWEAGKLTDVTENGINQLLWSESGKRELINRQLLKKFHQVCLFINAAIKLDDYQLQQLNGWKSSGIPVRAVLVNVPLYQLEKLIGELPKKRSRFRQRIKMFLKRYSK